MKLASFDIEISDELSSPGEPGWPPHISCAAIAIANLENPEIGPDVLFFASAPGNDSMTPSEVDGLSSVIMNLLNAFALI